MTLVFAFLMGFSAHALELKFPYYTVDVDCVGGGHRLFLSADFSESPFFESAILDGNEEGPNIQATRDAITGVVTHSKPGVFVVSLPADPKLRRFETLVDIRGQNVPMICAIDLDWHILK